VNKDKSPLNSLYFSINNLNSPVNFTAFKSSRESLMAIPKLCPGYGLEHSFSALERWLSKLPSQDLTLKDPVTPEEETVSSEAFETLSTESSEFLSTEPCQLLRNESSELLFHARAFSQLSYPDPAIPPVIQACKEIVQNVAGEIFRNPPAETDLQFADLALRIIRPLPIHLACKPSEENYSAIPQADYEYRIQALKRHVSQFKRKLTDVDSEAISSKPISNLISEIEKAVELLEKQSLDLIQRSILQKKCPEELHAFESFIESSDLFDPDQMEQAINLCEKTYEMTLKSTVQITHHKDDLPQWIPLGIETKRALTKLLLTRYSAWISSHLLGLHSIYRSKNKTAIQESLYKVSKALNFSCTLEHEFRDQFINLDSDRVVSDAQKGLSRHLIYLLSSELECELSEMEIFISEHPVFVELETEDIRSIFSIWFDIETKYKSLKSLIKSPTESQFVITPEAGRRFSCISEKFGKIENWITKDFDKDKESEEAKKAD